MSSRSKQQKEGRNDSYRLRVGLLYRCDDTSYERTYPTHGQKKSPSL